MRSRYKLQMQPAVHLRLGPRQMWQKWTQCTHVSLKTWTGSVSLKNAGQEWRSPLSAFHPLHRSLCFNCKSIENMKRHQPAITNRLSYQEAPTGIFRTLLGDTLFPSNWAGRRQAGRRFTAKLMRRQLCPFRLLRCHECRLFYAD